MEFTKKFARKNAIMLLIAFALPIISKLGVAIPNIQMLTLDEIPILFKFELVYPLLAGVALFFVMKLDRTVRGIAYVAIAALPFLIVLADSDLKNLIFSSFAKYGLTQLVSSGIILIISFLAILMLLSGSVIAQAKPSNKVGHRIAMIGGILYFITLVYPIQGFNGTTISLLIPYQMGTMVRGNDMVRIMMFIMYANIVFMSIASYKAIMLGKSTNKTQTGKQIIKLWYSSLTVYLTIGIIMLMRVPSAQLGEVLLMTALALVKVLAWIFGLYLLLPLGIAEIVMGTTENNNTPPAEDVVVNRFE